MMVRAHEYMNVFQKVTHSTWAKCFNSISLLDLIKTYDIVLLTATETFIIKCC